MDQQLLQFLNTHNIRYVSHTHEAVFTVDAADRVFPNIAGMHVKNLFLKDRYKKFYLVCIEAHKRLSIKDFGRKFGIKDLSFGSPEELLREMHLTPGSVSLFGLIYAKDINVYMDEDIWTAKLVGWHPNINTATIMITHEGLDTFLKAINTIPIIFDKLSS